MTSATCDHKWREYTDEEMSTLRSQTRQGRPSGAWVEGAEQCESCGACESGRSPIAGFAWANGGN